MKYPERWEQLNRIPDFLKEIKIFRIEHLFDLKLDKIECGSFLIRNEKNQILFQHVGYDSRIEKDLLILKSFVRSVADHFRFPTTQSILLDDRTLSSSFTDISDQSKVLLQLTKPNASECMYVLSQKIQFTGFPSEITSTSPAEGINHYIHLILSKNGYVLQIPDDPHIWRSFGYTEPLFPGQKNWIESVLHFYKIPYTASDDCLLRFYSLSDFLEAYDRFILLSKKK